MKVLSLVLALPSGVCVVAQEASDIEVTLEGLRKLEGLVAFIDEMAKRRT